MKTQIIVKSRPAQQAPTVPPPDTLPASITNSSNNDTIPLAGFGQTYDTYVVTAGGWSNANTWNTGSVPTATSKVYIQPGATVQLDTPSATCKHLVIGGTLNCVANSPRGLIYDTILVLATGTLTLTSSSLAGTIDIVQRDTYLDPVNDASLYWPGLIVFGTITVTGMQKTSFVRVAASLTAGQTSIPLYSAPSGWNVGDKVFFPDCRCLTDAQVNATPFVGNWEARTIAGISGTTLTVAALSFAHPRGKNGLNVEDSYPTGTPPEGAWAWAGEPFAPHVGNLTRTIVFRSESPLGMRGHVFVTDRCVADIRYAEFQDLGRTTVNSIGITQTGSPQAVGASTITLNAFALAVDHAFVNLKVKITAGIGNGQAKKILAYNGATKQCTLDSPWTTLPTTSSTYVVGNAPYTALGNFNAGAISPAVGLCQTPPGTGLTAVRLAAGESTRTDVYKNSIVVILNGPGVGQAALVTAYDGTTKDCTLDKPFTVATTSASTYKVVNHAGRYALHAHHIFGPFPVIGPYQYYFIGNSFTNVGGDGAELNHKWFIAFHDSHYGRIAENVFANSSGAWVMGEDGNESYNVVEDNCGLRLNGIGGRLINSLANNSPGSNGSGFYFRGPVNYVRRNHACNFRPIDVYGYAPFFENTGDIDIPNFQGASTSIAGQFTDTDVRTVPLLEFADNESYGGGNGFAPWHVGSSSASSFATEWSYVRRSSCWNFHDRGTFMYPANRCEWNGYIIRSNPVSNSAVGWFMDDYEGAHIVLKNFDVQGTLVGIWTPINAIVDENGQLTPYEVDDCYCRTDIGVHIQMPRTRDSTSDSLRPKTTIIRRFKYDLMFNKVTSRAINMTDSHTSGSTNMIVRDETFVYDFQPATRYGTSGDHFQVWCNEARAASICPPSIGAGTSHQLTACHDNSGTPVVGGMANSVYLATYGRRVSGSTPPTSGTVTKPGVVGTGNVLADCLVIPPEP